MSVYILPDVSEINFTNYVEKECFTKEEMEMKILKFVINQNCNKFQKNKLF